MTPTKDSSKDQKHRRKHIRFKPDEGKFACIDFQVEEKGFNPSTYALIFNEAYKGCGLVVIKDPKLRQGRLIKVKVGELAPCTAEVRWITPLHEGVWMIGLAYI